MREVLTFILAGGKGERLNPLTRDRAKPAVPFGGIYRIIDFTLSNCVNSELRKIYVLIQYKSFSLQKHVLSGWNLFAGELGEYIDIIPAQQRIGSDWYKGTADAIYQNIYAIHDANPELVLILAGDHIYKMDYRLMINFHKEKKADMTVACVQMPIETASNFGIVEVDSNNGICGFKEKPEHPKPIPGEPDKVFASMGIYLFNTDVLLTEMEKDAKVSSSDHDFGKNVIPEMLKNKRKLFVYNFVDEHNKPKYWRDIGTRDAYYQANMDLVKPVPEFNLFDKSWPIRTYHEQYPPIKVISSDADKDMNNVGFLTDSIISGGCVLHGADVKGSVISNDVRIGKHAKVSDSVIMEGVKIGEGAKIKNAIIDKAVVIPPNTKIGYDLEADRKNFDMTTSGIVIVPKKSLIPNQK